MLLNWQWRFPNPGPVFLPVDVTKQQDMTVANDGAEPDMLENDVACGHRLRIKGAYDGDALARLIRGLSA